MFELGNTQGNHTAKFIILLKCPLVLTKQIWFVRILVSTLDIKCYCFILLLHRVRVITLYKNGWYYDHWVNCIYSRPAWLFRRQVCGLELSNNSAGPLKILISKWATHERPGRIPKHLALWSIWNRSSSAGPRLGSLQIRLRKRHSIPSNLTVIEPNCPLNIKQWNATLSLHQVIQIPS